MKSKLKLFPIKFYDQKRCEKYGKRYRMQYACSKTVSLHRITRKPKNEVTPFKERLNTII